MEQRVYVFIGGYAAVMTALLIFLGWEYHAIRLQTVRIVEIKNEYKNHLTAVKNIIQEYNELRDTCERLQEQVGGNEKKNDVPEQPENTSMTSYDVSDDFLVINRDLEYLKQSTLAYIKGENLAFLLDRISPDEWSEYTEQVQEKVRQAAQKRPSKKARRRKRTMLARKNTLVSPLAVVGQERSTDMRFIWPIDRSSFWLSSVFGPRKKKRGACEFHYGIDLAALKGTPVHACASGVVTEARREGESGGYGNTVVITHNRKYRTRYAHLKSIYVRVGQQVGQDTCIGSVGDTGRVRSHGRGKDASHLHLEVYAFGKKVDPLYFLA